MLYYIEKLD